MLPNSPLLEPDRALAIAEELFRSMLPESEAAFREELQLWHPKLDAGRYLASQTYPRCWVVTAALIVATAFPEYALLLLESLRQRPDTLRAVDVRVAETFEPDAFSSLDKESWRTAICSVGRLLYFFSPQTQTRAFAVGLNFAFVRPEASRAFVDIARTTAQDTYERQVAAAAAVVQRYPLSGQV